MTVTVATFVKKMNIIKLQILIYLFIFMQDKFEENVKYLPQNLVWLAKQFI